MTHHVPDDTNPRVAPTGIEPANRQFSTVQFGLSFCKRVRPARRLRRQDRLTDSRRGTTVAPPWHSDANKPPSSFALRVPTGMGLEARGVFVSFGPQWDAQVLSRRIAKQPLDAGMGPVIRRW